jgi:hypothetical protein
MADKKISALPAATVPLGGTEVLPIVQGGTTDKVSVSDLTAGRTPLVAGVRATNATAANFRGYEIGNTDGDATVFGFWKMELSTGLSRIASGFTGWGGALALTTNGVDRLSISSSGDVTTNTGNLVIGTTGKGIDFSAATHAAGMTSELLNDYEEGTWTPTGNNVTFASASGKYTKIGRQVTVTFDVTMPSTANADQCQLQGLPFTVGSGGGASIGYTTNSNVVTFLAGDTGTSLNGYLFGGSALANVTYSGARVVGSCTYFV